MSLGPLRGLAARALGAAAPLRAHRPAAPAAADEPVEDRVPVDLSMPGPVPRTEIASIDDAFADHAVSEGEQTVRPKPPAAREPKIPRAPALVGETPRSARQVTDETHRPSTGIKEVPAAPAAVASGRRSAAPDPAPVKPAPADGDPTPAPAVDRVPMPMLPVQPQAPLPLVDASAVPTRRDGPTSTRSATAPTEVHVSIGRVELTAVTAAPATRAASRRDSSDGRSLADYLRGGGSSKRPA